MPTVFDIEVKYEDDYSKAYHGQMGKEDFESALPDAQAEVNDAVWSGANLSTCEKQIKMALCAVADIIGNPDKRLKSYSAGKVREEYGSAGYSLTTAAAIRRWLSGTGVLKRGKWL